MGKGVGSLLCSLLLGASAAATSAAAKPTTREILSGTIFGGDEIEKVLEGKMVTTPVREVSRREIGVGLACLVPAGRRASLAVLRNADPVMPEKYRDASGRLDVGDLGAGFAALEIGKGAEDEAERFLSVEPGYEMNLSKAEMAAFNALQPAKGQEVAAVEAQLRSVLAERVRAYRKSGTAGIAGFAREDGEASSPGKEMQDTTEGLDGYRKAFPEFHAAILRYPRGGLKHEEFWFWTRIQVLGRPVFMLHQRLAAEKGEIQIVVERQIYASHFLDIGQTVTAILPVQEGTLLFNIYRTWVDQWSGPGFAVGAKRKVGTELIGSVLRSQSDQLRFCEGE